MCCATFLMAGSAYGQGDIDALLGYLAAAAAIIYARLRMRGMYGRPEVA
jgi:hypothetical protein